MSGVAAEEKQVDDSTSLREINFEEVRAFQRGPAHRSVSNGKSFYFNPKSGPTIGNPVDVKYLAFLVAQDKYFVTKKDSSQSSYYTISINGGQETKIGIYPEDEVLPRYKPPGQGLDAKCREIENRVRELDDTSTRKSTQDRLPGIREEFANKDFDKWCQEQSTAVYIENDDVLHRLLCTPKSA